MAASWRLFSDSRLTSLHWRGGCSNLSPSAAPTSRPFSTLYQDQGVPAFVLRIKYQLYFCFKLTTSSTSSSSSMSPLGDLEEENLESNETESPYNSKTSSLETRELKLEEDANGVDSSSSGFYFQNESKWDDHSSYGAKKTQQAWCKLSNGDWTLGKVLSNSGLETVISLPQEKVSFQVADSLQQPFPYGQFDLVWSTESGEHMPNKVKFVSELARVAAPGATIIIVTWLMQFSLFYH